MYQYSLAWHLENLPGLKPAYKAIYKTTPWIRDMYVFRPSIEISCESENDCIDLTANE